MSELDRFSPELGNARGGFGRLVRSVLGRLGAGSAVNVGTEIEPYRGDVVPADEAIMGEIAEGGLALRPNTARLPEEFIETDTLAQLKEGKSAFTVPWGYGCYARGLLHPKW